MPPALRTLASTTARTLTLALSLGALSGCARPAGGAPEVGESSARRVILPTRFGWLSSEQTTGPLPSAVALGGASGRVLLYLEFPPPSEGRRLLRADLVLSPGGSAADAVDVEVTRSKTAGSKLDSWSDQPSSVYPSVDARVTGGGLPARLDVTELLRAHTKAGEPFCMLVKAEPSDGAAVLVATGAAGGDGPRLEAYWE